MSTKFSHGQFRHRKNMAHVLLRRLVDWGHFNRGRDDFQPVNSPATETRLVRPVAAEVAVEPARPSWWAAAFERVRSLLFDW